MSKAKEALLNPIFNDNPIALQILGICSALAVTGNLYITSNYVCSFNYSCYSI